MDADPSSDREGSEDPMVLDETQPPSAPSVPTVVPNAAAAAAGAADSPFSMASAPDSASATRRPQPHPRSHGTPTSPASHRSRSSMSRSSASSVGPGRSLDLGGRRPDPAPNATSPVRSPGPAPGPAAGTPQRRRPADAAMASPALSVGSTSRAADAALDRATGAHGGRTPGRNSTPGRSPYGSSARSPPPSASAASPRRRIRGGILFRSSPAPFVPSTPAGGGGGSVPATPAANFASPAPPPGSAVPATPAGSAVPPTLAAPGSAIPPTPAAGDGDGAGAGEDRGGGGGGGGPILLEEGYVPPPRSDLHGPALSRFIDDFDDVGPVLSAPAADEDAGGSGGGGGDGDDDDDDDDDGRSRRSDSSSRRIDFGASGGAGGDGGGGGGGDGGGMPPAGDDNVDDAADGVGTQNLTQIRGTDIHVQTAALAFQDFIRNFVSVEESSKALRREERARRRVEREQRRADEGHGYDSDAASSVSSDTTASSDGSRASDGGAPPASKRGLYASCLRAILLGDTGAGTTTSAPVEGASVPGSEANPTAALDINSLHLYYHSPACQRLYHQLLSYPAEIVPLMDLILQRELESTHLALHEEMTNDADPLIDYELAFDQLPEVGGTLPRVQVRPYNLRSLSHMRSLDPNAIDTLLTIRGMVVRSSPIIPDLKVAHFGCTVCGTAVNVTIDRGRIAEPTRCATCNVKGAYELIHNRCVYSDKQMVRIQETPDEVPAGETPASIVLFAYDDLVDSVRPGDRVEVTGVFRAQARRVNPKITRVKSVYRTYLDAIHFCRVGAGTDPRKTASSTDGGKKQSKKKGAEADGGQGGVGKGIADDRSSGTKLSEERVRQLEELSRSPDIYEKLTKGLAPSIWELDDVKKGVLAMLFGGNSKRVKRGTAAKKEKQQLRTGGDGFDSMDEGEVMGNDDNAMDEDEEEDDDPKSRKLNKRGDINILLCGDPGTAKSQLLGYVHKLAPRGVYTSGKGSSAVGLTASIARDPETRDLVLESGALVLSDLGICCIDEFDKMSDTTRAILHEAMEQQTVSIAKAGIIATLNARTSILASANPVESRYNPQLSVVENIKLSPTLLSRFDLIYLILDSPNVENDRRLAQHLVGLYYETPNVVEPPLDHDILRDYIAYARDNIHPELSDLATRELISAYLDMRRIGSGSSGGGGSRTISATPRQLESLIRLSEALARMRYSRVVARSDVREAVRLMKVATQAAATDPRTGKIDMDMITTGRSSADRANEESLNTSLKELLAERRGTRMAVSDVRRQLTESINTTLQNEEVVDALRRMEADGFIQLNERAQTVFVRAGVAT